MNNHSNSIKTLPSEDELKKYKVFVVKAPPRVGKTRWCIQLLVDAGQGNYVSHRYSIVEHALRIFKELKPDARVVKLKGKYREGMCISGEWNCTECPLKPDEHRDEHVGHFEMEELAKRLLDRYKVLDEEIIANISIEELKKIYREVAEKIGKPCPYYTLMYAEKQADYCFTVVHFIDRITPRKLLVIDETPTIYHFYPRSVEICEIVIDDTSSSANKELAQYMTRLEEIEEKITAKKRKTKEDKVILDIINQFKQLNSILKMSDPRKVLEYKEELLNFIPKADLSKYDTTPEAVLEKLSEYAYPDEYDPLALFEAILYPYKLHVFWDRSDGNHRHTLYLIGNAEKPILHTTILNDPRTQKIVIVGGIEAEIFATQIAPDNCVVLENKDFPYKRNYLVYPIDASGGKKEEEEWKKKIKRRKKLIKIVKELRKDGISPIIFTGSKRKQLQILEKFKRMAYRVRDETVEELKRLQQAELVLISYANSQISRGLDIPFIDVCAIYDATFASPFWQAKLEYCKQNGLKEEARLAEYVLNEIIIEETTNMALRISPTPNHEPYQPKIVLIPRDELWKIKYIEDRVVGHKNGGYVKLDTIANQIKEIVGRSIEVMSIEGMEAIGEKVAEVLKAEKKLGEGSKVLTIVAQKRKERASFWQKAVKEDRLLIAPIELSRAKRIEVDSSLFNVIKDIVVRILKEVRTRINHDRLRRMVARLSPIKKHETIDKILVELVKMRVIKRERVGRKWLYSLRENG